MKRFIFSVFTVSVFFLGLGAIVEQTGARFKSDEKALDLIRKARVAIGGEAAIANIQSMVIVGRTSQKFTIEGVERVHDGDTEIALQFPDKFTRSTSMNKAEHAGAEDKIVRRVVDEVVVVGDKAKAGGEVNNGKQAKIIMKKDDGTVVELTGDDAIKWIEAHPNEGGTKTITMRKADGTTGDYTAVIKGSPRIEANDGATFTSKDGKTFDIEKVRVAHGPEGARHNQMLRTTLALLLTAPAGIDVSYTFAGEGAVDGTACNIVVASFGGESFRLFLDRSSNLPVAISFKAMPVPHVVAFKHDGTAPEAAKDTVMFRKMAGEKADVQIKFSDFRSVNGVQLPFRWTQTGGVDETFNVTSYEINPANIEQRFMKEKISLPRKKAVTE